MWVFNAISQYFSYIMVISFISGENQSTERRPSTYHKSMTNFITQSCIKYTQINDKLYHTKVVSSTHKSMTNFITQSCIKYTQINDELYHTKLCQVHLTTDRNQLTTLEVIGTDYIDGCKSNYHVIMS